MDLGACTLGFAAGILTALSPCVLPLLAVTVSTALQQHRYGPLALAAGLAGSATALGLIFAMVGFAVDRDLVRIVAAALLIVVGGILLIPRLQESFARLTAPVASGGAALLTRATPGGWPGQLVVGALLGAIWSPCAGPTLAAAIGLAAQRTNLVSATAVLAAFSLGAVLPLLAVAYGSRELLHGRVREIARVARPATAAVFIVVGVLTLSGGDRAIETRLVDLMPDWLIDLTTRY